MVIPTILMLTTTAHLAQITLELQILAQIPSPKLMELLLKQTFSRVLIPVVTAQVLMLAEEQLLHQETLRQLLPSQTVAQVTQINNHKGRFLAQLISQTPS